jgi:hypothetical protein
MLLTSSRGLNDFYAGAENLQQNSYMNFANENLFLSPTLDIKPTDQQYDVLLV